MWTVRLSGRLVCETSKPYEALGHMIEDPVNAVVTRNGVIVWPPPDEIIYPD